MTETQLIRKAVKLFPILQVASTGPVRHLRREWVRASIQLQKNPPRAAFWAHIVTLH
jgi:hypothetical protein